MGSGANNIVGCRFHTYIMRAIFLFSNLLILHLANSILYSTITMHKLCRFSNVLNRGQGRIQAEERSEELDKNI